MPWLEVNRVILREQLALIWEAGEPVSRLCRQFGVSPKTAYKWLRRWQEQGVEGLKDRSRAPLHHANQTPLETVELIESIRGEHPAWGPLKIKARLELDGRRMPSARTVGNVLRRQGLIQAPQPPKPPPQRFERDRPHELWQMDAKGWFILRGLGRVYPVSVIDDHSRYLLALRACRREDFSSLRHTLYSALQAYGCPERLLTDRHPVFHQEGTLTAWECLLIALGIKVSHSGVRKPTTQGKVERVHRTVGEELIRRYRFAGLEDCQRAFDEYRQMYNTYRPHQALAGQVPVSRFHRSPRPLPDPMPAPSYEPGAIVRCVNAAGLISIGGRTHFVGKGLAGWPVGVLPRESQHWPVMFYDRVVGKVPAPKA